VGAVGGQKEGNEEGGEHREMNRAKSNDSSSTKVNNRSFVHHPPAPDSNLDVVVIELITQIRLHLVEEIGFAQFQAGSNVEVSITNKKPSVVIQAKHKTNRKEGELCEHERKKKIDT
jgi:hypothetical protein